MTDHLTRVAEAVRDACAETCNEQHTIAERRPIPATICAMHIGHIDLPAVIARVPRPEPAAWLFRHPAAGYLTVTDSGNATDDGVFPVYAEPVAAQVAVPEQWQAVARECVSHLDDGRTQPALSRSLRKLSAMLDSSVAPPVSVSHGWKLVPVEPTPDMLMAAGAAVHSATYWHSAYRAMLAAAPEAPQPDDDDFELTCPEPPARDDRKAIKRLSDAVSEICFQSGESEDEFTKWLADGGMLELLESSIKAMKLEKAVEAAGKKNAALVAAMQNIADEFVPGDEQKLYGTPTDVLDRIRSTAWAALASAKSGAE